MPGPWHVVTERLILHLIQFAIILDDVIISIAMIGEHIVADAVPAGPPNDLATVLTHKIAGSTEVSRILQFERDVVHPR